MINSIFLLIVILYKTSNLRAVYFLCSGQAFLSGLKNVPDMEKLAADLDKHACPDRPPSDVSGSSSPVESGDSASQGKYFCNLYKIIIKCLRENYQKEKSWRSAYILPYSRDNRLIYKRVCQLRH